MLYNKPRLIFKRVLSIQPRAKRANNKNILIRDVANIGEFSSQVIMGLVVSYFIAFSNLLLLNSTKDISTFTEGISSLTFSILSAVAGWVFIISPPDAWP